ncbi:hypothetical protein SAMN06296036_104132 [Pseudobacteriovorax antillogorgiicola]|uniref:Uncharacterized protein n=1 Tax=Pseudobacteriovorax antillogorgiicola TaxID=1513793 RepID=A0A1Y6BDT6_9BACT|nr:hypothetical protein EDD56_104201 [Pseudobacteriovorax antillogorgiicola]SMF06436.1 hypothetical protein SAMN06296036_104132 [Pseudobacteriovorax antillogorgiicola]
MAQNTLILCFTFGNKWPIVSMLASVWLAKGSLKVSDQNMVKSARSLPDDL